RNRLSTPFFCVFSRFLHRPFFRGGIFIISYPASFVNTQFLAIFSSLPCYSAGRSVYHIKLNFASVLFWI
ncbi:MAG: hypothetical protein DIU81_006305, partial [[Clostridium] cellulosi]